ncbi:MAG: sulfatase [Actinobacteria bacterium]|nr:sulfatase [Actinomycetota bacterium]
MKNVILITVDTLRKDMLKAYGSKDGLTPFIDSLSGSSIIFKNPYATGPYTQASFQGILSSSYYLEYGKEKNLSKYKTLVSEPLKNAGIYTAGFHSNAYLSYYFGYNKGWETFYDSMSDNVTDMYPFLRGDFINRKVSDFLNNFSFSKPLFLWVHYMDVHEPYIAEEKYLAHIDPSIKLSNDEMFLLFKNTILPRDITDKSKVDILKKLYMAKVAETDDYTKDLFSIFDSHKLLDNSTVIITSDHGDEFAEHNGLSHDGKMYNELLSVPLLVYDKSYKSNIIDTPVSLIDLSPTVCRLFGVEPAPSFKGKSLYPYESVTPYTIYGEAMGKIGHKEKDTDKPVYYMLDEGLKLIYKEEEQSYQAYDIAADKPEKLDISAHIDKKIKSKLNSFITRNKQKG